MEKRNIELTLETATRWYNGADKELKALAVQTFPELEKKQLPKTWGELNEIKGYYVSSTSELAYANCITGDRNKNVFAKEEQAEASIALAQLSQLREVYRDGWVPDWTDFSKKYTIEFCVDKITTDWGVGAGYFLTFQDEETRDLFLVNFHELILKAAPLMQ